MGETGQWVRNSLTIEYLSPTLPITIPLLIMKMHVARTCATSSTNPLALRDATTVESRRAPVFQVAVERRVCTVPNDDVITDARTPPNVDDAGVTGRTGLPAGVLPVEVAWKSMASPPAP
jgi:hypothetical protein